MESAQFSYLLTVQGQVQTDFRAVIILPKQKGKAPRYGDTLS